jgi:pimeloyl-ACP methyl ester carboxylesterase
VAALVVRADHAHPGAASLAAHARAALAGYKVPVSFVRVRSLPRTAGGKLQRAEVRSMLERPLTGSVARPDGTQIGWRSTGAGQRTVVLLHGTLSTAAQLDRLAGSIAEPGDVTVLAVDRRGSGSSPLGGSAPVDIAVHLDDLLAVLDHHGLGLVEVVGLSYGGVVALEAAARHPERVRGVIAWEPPYGPLADGPTRDRFAALAASTAAAHRAGGPSAAAEVFLRAVAGNAAWERLSDSGRTFLARQGDGALSDSALLGLEAAGLAGIAVPVTLLTGSASEPFYAPIARSVVERIPGAELVELEGLGHAAPLTEPARVAAAIRAQLEHRP